jgi:hypothetical protein
MKAAGLTTSCMLTRLKLRYGLMTTAQAVEWAAKKSRELGDPPLFIAQVAELQKPSARRVIELLDGGLRGSSQIAGLRMLFGGLHAPLAKNPRLVRKFATVLSKIAARWGQKLPTDMRNMNVFLERLDRVAAGKSFPGDSALRVAADLLAFLGLFKKHL